MDLWIQDGKIIAAPEGRRPRLVLRRDPIGRVLDATGLVVMPGGVDMHAHIAGPKVNVARKMRPEDRRKAPVVRRTPLTRSGTTGSIPSTFATGYLYAGMGYTTAFDAAIPPLSARHAHEEFHDTPIIDKGFFVLFGNNHYALKQIAAREPEKLRAFTAWLLAAAKGYAVKLVNPGGVEVWKKRRSSAARSRYTDRAFRRDGARRRSSPNVWPQRRRWTCGPCPTPSTSTATTSACPATGGPRSPRCRSAGRPTRTS